MKKFVSRFYYLLFLEWQAIRHADFQHRHYSIRSFPARLSKVITNKREFDWKGSIVEFESRFGAILVQDHDQTAKQIKAKITWAEKLVVLDIGANTGQFGIGMLNNFSNIEIHSFEPNFEPFQILLKNASNKDNWRVYNCGVGSKTETVNFFWIPKKSGQGSIHQENAHRSIFRSSKADLRNTLIDLIEVSDLIAKTNLKAFDLIKVDVEGAEAIVLNQIKELSWRFIVVEVGRNRIGSINEDQVLDILTTQISDPKVIGIIGNRSEDLYDLIVKNQKASLK